MEGLISRITVATIGPLQSYLQQQGGNERGKNNGKDEVKESILPLEACGTSVLIGPSAQILVHL
jgi:hypothetical protein